MTNSTVPPAEKEAVKPENPEDRTPPLRSWQEKLLNGILYAASGLGLPAFLAGSIAALRNGCSNAPRTNFCASMSRPCT